MFNTYKNITNNRVLVFVLFLIVLLYVFMWTACIPALPTIAKYYAQDKNQIYNIVINYLFGVGISQIFYGSMSDIFGRRSILLVGNFISIIGSFVVLVSDSLDVMLVGRFIQGIGAGSFVVVWKAIARDITIGKSDTFISIVSSMMIVAGVLQIISPIVGGYITVFSNWRTIFFVMLLCSILSFFYIFIFLPETLANPLQHYSVLNYINKNLKSIITNLDFWSFTLISSVALSAVTIFQYSSSFILENQLGLQPNQLAYMPVFNVVGFYMGNTFAHKYLSKQLYYFIFAIFFMFVGASIMHTYTTSTILKLMLPMFIYSLGTGIIIPFATAYAIVKHENIGFVSSFTGTIQMLVVTCFCKFFNAHMQITTQRSIAKILFICTLINLLIYFAHICIDSQGKLKNK
ncbi:MFS transporter (plasmid) [Candidatus Bandiella numerosa]|jgi:DHA1 family 2-module integral membrane pump EmrD-like MFS transporter|uniref:MFS transporter n=1 Tax=Candidatus Bandiella numerosa TaxID=2570586 RepID=UPI00249DED5C|nr:MFS transporter [Candidatus Bandiella numerosa]WHA05714.1 MFS transporter [Candidatus Bandiella numerosa]